MKVFSKLTRFNDYGLLILRLGIGFIFIAHGMLKWGLWSVQPSEQLSASMLIILRILSIAEPLGAIVIIVGFWTPLASIGISILMIGVINMKINAMNLGFIGQNGTGWELDFIVLCSALCILFTGPGKISLEKLLSKK